MLKITTNDCKKFLVSFFTNSPYMVGKIYDGVQEESVKKDAINIEKWKRESKMSSQDENSIFNVFGEYRIYKPGLRFERGPHYAPSEPFPVQDVVCERVFILDPDTYEDGVKFVVIEDKNGNLHLGPYIGD